MTNVVVVGLQWGDEGKGRVVDWLSESADVVVRFQGGHNAGHTLVVDGKTYKLSLLPSGVVREGKSGLIGNGVVIDPYALISEMETLEKQGIRIDPDRLGIADNATLILSVHRELDTLREDTAADLGTEIGTTRRGIGPAYEDKAGRRAIRVMDLGNPETLSAKIDRLLVHHNALRRGLGQPEVSNRQIYEELMAVAERILPFCKKVWRLLDREIKKGSRILFEGAQGVLLDIDHGTYPFVTSSNTVAGQFSSGTGLGPGTVSHVMGIAKAYTTRVGEGPFPTELFDDAGQILGKRGNEFGTVTGRSRRCGWFDAVLARQAVSVSGVDSVALTKLDVMDGFEEIKICVGYELDGRKIDYLPASQGQQAGVKPVYQTFEGWRGSVAGVRSWEDLPIQAINYVKNVEKLTGTSVALLTTSPERADTILVHDPFQG